jgi:hypothetical protein
MLLILKKEQIESHRLRALAQAIINKEKGPEAFDEFRASAFPWVKTQQKRDQAEHIKLLEAEVKRGVLGITPLVDNTKQVRSRLKTKVVSSQPEALRRSSKEMKSIYSKMGGVVPR